jgi:hypothetical protein
MELGANDLVVLELLRARGAMTSTQLQLLGLRRSAAELQTQLRGLAADGLVETRLNLYVINDAGIAALKRAVAQRAQALRPPGE